MVLSWKSRRDTQLRKTNDKQERTNSATSPRNLEVAEICYGLFGV